MKRAIVLSLAVAILMGNAFAGGSKKEQKIREIAREEARKEIRKEFKTLVANSIKVALQNQDFNSAIAFINMYLALDSSRSTLKDTLIELYLITGQANQALVLAEQKLKQNPNDTSAMHIAAIASMQLNNLQKAYEYYTRLAQATGNVKHLWDFAVVLWQMQRYGDALVVIDQIIANPAARSQTVTLQISPTTKQEVPLLAAAYNLKGAAHQRLKDLNAAKEAYQKALEVVPDFILPKENLEALKQQEQQNNSGSNQQKK
ncbi:MAG: tetratricopeptide repeat protein [Chlorobi bacterium]|nr:tetratricopeptide repeat protein [Chlorobiota bacterium]